MADDFPDNQWTTLKARMESDGPERVIEYIDRGGTGLRLARILSGCALRYLRLRL